MPERRDQRPTGTTGATRPCAPGAARRPPATPRRTATQTPARSSTRATSSVSYGGKPCRRGRQLDVHQHEITALIGPSGCGKSTFLRCLNRMNDLIPAARVDGRDRLPRREPLRPQHRPGAGAQAHRDGLPEAQPVPEVDLRQHRVRPARARHEGQHGRDRRGRAAPRRRCGTRSRTASRTTPSACPAASSSACASPARWPPSPT